MARSAGRCPRCNGTMREESDTHGIYDACFMCGYVREAAAVTLAVARAEAESEEHPYVAARAAGLRA